MTDLMKLADAFAEYKDHSEYVHSRAALQSAIEALQSKLDTAIQSSARWQHQCTELQAKVDAMGKGEAVQFLCDATRFKVRQHEGDEAGRIYGLPSELNGRWVALVAADDDCHLKLAAPKALEPLSREAVKALVAEADYTHASAQSKADFINGIRHSEKAHGIHAKGGQHEDA